MATLSGDSRLERVREMLAKFEHPLLAFDARPNRDAVQVIIQMKNVTVPVHTYYFDLHPRDLDHPQFAWTFERQLYDCLHDYLIEMFTRAPHTKT
ncbi:MAG TPA: hypothetical protein VK473_12485 [Terriglobales bacterium]|nr:hypothetical protein [Terriglobales bacterium]